MTTAAERAGALAQCSSWCCVGQSHSFSSLEEGITWGFTQNTFLSISLRKAFKLLTKESGSTSDVYVAGGARVLLTCSVKAWACL